MDSHENEVKSILDQIDVSYPQNVVADALSLLCRLINNILQNATEDKFHHIKLSNKTLATKLFNIAQMGALLEQLGFIQLEDEYFLPMENFGMLIEGTNEVRWTEELARARLDGPAQYKKIKEMVDSQRSITQSNEKDQKEKNKIQQQLNYDKQERKHMKAKDSVAKELKFGANVKRYKSRRRMKMSEAEVAITFASHLLLKDNEVNRQGLQTYMIREQTNYKFSL